MNNLFMIAFNNMKKQKGDMITFFVMILISSFLIFNSASDIMGISKAYDKRFEEVNGAHMLAAVDRSDVSRECIEKAFEKSGISEYESTPVIYGAVQYKNGSDDSYMDYEFIFERFNDDPQIMDVVPEGTTLADDEVLLPLLMKGSFEEGDVLALKIDEDDYELKVAGFTENPYFCSSMNIAMNYVYVSPSFFEGLDGKELVNVKKFDLYKGIVDAPDADLGKIEQEITEEYNRLITPYTEQDPEAGYELGLTINWSLVRMGNTIFPYVAVAIILVFALMILLISLITISFSVSNFIQRNMKNTGILEACGYTVRELKNALTLQLLLVALAGTAAGIAISFFSIPVMGSVFTYLLGITWNQNIDMTAALIATALMFLVVFITVRIISRKYNSVTVLDALRGGISSHNFKKNFFSFEKTDLPLPVTLSLKETFGSLRKNIAMVLIVAILTISTLIGFGMMENFKVDKDSPLFSVMGFELGNMGIVAQEGLSDDLREIEGVKNVYVSQTRELTVEYQGVSEKYNTFGVEDMEYAINTVLIEGRVPKSDNEIMLTWTVAKDLGAQVGDVVTLKAGDKTAEFIVVGLNQKMQNAGRTTVVTLDAFERLDIRSNISEYYITSEDGVDYKTLESRVKDYAEEHDIQLMTSNTEDLMEGSVSGIATALKAMGIILAVLTALIVIFVESLIVRAKITREWRGMGINKALGMSTMELISQIAISNIPAIITGCLLGALLAQPAGKAVIMGTFSYMGIKKIAFGLPFFWIAVTAAGIILIALLTSGTAGLKVRKLIPIEMITEE